MSFEEPKLEKPLISSAEEAEESIEEKESQLEEEAEILRSHIKEKPRFIESRSMDFLLGLTPKEMEAVLWKEGMDLVLGVISETRKLLRQMEDEGIGEADLKKFIKENGNEMLPRQVSRAFDKQKDAATDADILINTAALCAMELPIPIRDPRKRMEENIGLLKESLMCLSKENNSWRSSLSFDRAKEERPMSVAGFEKFDFLGIKGREAVETAAQILPRGLSSVNTAKIEYQNEVKPMSKNYGIGGCSMATFHPGEEGGGAEIVFRRPAGYAGLDWGWVSYLRNLPIVLAHEFGHSIDPRIVDQKDLSPGMQMRMILEWEEVRKQEPEFSTYVQSIKNPDAHQELVLKEWESFAESCAAFLEDPHSFRELCPKRGRFFDFWMKTRFPGMDFIDDREKQAERHQKIYSFLDKIYSAERKT